MTMGPFRARTSGVPNTDRLFAGEICTIRRAFGKWLFLEVPTGRTNLIGLVLCVIDPSELDC